MDCVSGYGAGAQNLLAMRQGVNRFPTGTFPHPSLTSSPALLPSAAILIAHLKLSTSELRQILMKMTTDRLEPAHIKQLLLYAPNDDEVKQYEQFEQDPAKLSEPDQFIFQVNTEEHKKSLKVARSEVDAPFRCWWCLSTRPACAASTSR